MSTPRSIPRLNHENWIVRDTRCSGMRRSQQSAVKTARRSPVCPGVVGVALAERSIGMDGSDFDNLVRELVGRATRRNVLRLSAAPLLGGVAGFAVAVNEASAGKKCKKRKQKACVGRMRDVAYTKKKKGHRPPRSGSAAPCRSRCSECTSICSSLSARARTPRGDRHQAGMTKVDDARQRPHHRQHRGHPAAGWTSNRRAGMPGRRDSGSGAYHRRRSAPRRRGT